MDKFFWIPAHKSEGTWRWDYMDESGLISVDKLLLSKGDIVTAKYNVEVNPKIKESEKCLATKVLFFKNGTISFQIKEANCNMKLASFSLCEVNFIINSVTTPLSAPVLNRPLTESSTHDSPDPSSTIPEPSTVSSTMTPTLLEETTLTSTSTFVSPLTQTSTESEKFNGTLIISTINDNSTVATTLTTMEPSTISSFSLTDSLSTLDQQTVTQKCKNLKKRSTDELPYIDLFFNPDRKSELESYLQAEKTKYERAFANMDYLRSYENMFELLWYSGNPCFDVVKYTSNYLDHKSFIKECHWKGKRVRCSSLFRITPTDKGMCCNLSFREDSLLLDNIYSRNIERLQQQDRNNSFDSHLEAQQLGNFVTKNVNVQNYAILFIGTDLPEVGIAKGLSIILDAHTDLQSNKSMGDDWAGFQIGLSVDGEVPMMEHGSYLLSPGHQHYLGISAVDTVSRKLSNIEPLRRGCLYNQEQKLEYHKVYSRSACIFECHLAWVTSKLNCKPWYFPVTEDKIKFCNPWESKAFMEELDLTPQHYCSHCLPDCDSTSYKLSLSSAPFRLSK